jgi:hypothetical protein
MEQPDAHLCARDHSHHRLLHDRRVMVRSGGVLIVLSISSPDRIAESLAGVFLSAYFGLSLPVVGAGITLARNVSPKTRILGFTIAVTLGIVGSAIKLVGGPTAEHPERRPIV